MTLKRISIILSFGILLSACSSTPNAPPSNAENLCAIFQQYPQWYEAAQKAQLRWGAPIHVMMAMMYQESSFRANARPAYQWALGFIPLGRPSSAYGYAQAKDEVWSEYRKQVNPHAKRNHFPDAIDFMGWYILKNYQRNKTSKWDAYLQYLAYHEGMGGYERGTYRSKPWLIRTAQIVKTRSLRYAKQLATCNPLLKTQTDD